MVEETNGERESAWYVKPIQLVGCAFLVLSTPIWLPLSIPFAYAMHLVHSTGERRFVQRMKDRGRFLEWEALRPALDAGEGMLVIEQGGKAPVRVWWSPEDILSQAPCPPPGEGELEALVHTLAPHDFVDWCHLRFLDEDAGTALLTLPPDLPDGYILASHFKARHPRINVIDTVYSRYGVLGREARTPLPPP